MRFDVNLINRICETSFKEGEDYKHLGLTDTTQNQTLTFAENIEFFQKALNNSNVSGILVDFKLKTLVQTKKNIYLCDKPREIFFKLFNELHSENRKKETNSKIAVSTIIGENSIISETGVYIGENCLIGDNVRIYSGASIDANCIIGSGSIIGSEGFEFKLIDGIRTRIVHNKKVKIGRNVEIGHNCVVDKGIFERDTTISDNVKIDSFTHIAHSSQIGNNALLASKVLMCGSSTVGKSSWIGPGAIVSSGVKVGEEAFVGIGSVVIKDVEAKTRVYGNPASANYMKYLKSAYE